MDRKVKILLPWPHPFENSRNRHQNGQMCAWTGISGGLLWPYLRQNKVSEIQGSIDSFPWTRSFPDTKPSFHSCFFSYSLISHFYKLFTYCRLTAFPFDKSIPKSALFHPQSFYSPHLLLFHTYHSLHICLHLCHSSIICILQRYFCDFPIFIHHLYRTVNIYVIPFTVSY